MLVVNRFRVPASDAESFRADLERAHRTLAVRPGYVAGHVGRNVDDPELWVLTTQWENVGAYRRALSAYDVKLAAVPMLSRAIDEPSAYEVVSRGRPQYRRDALVRLKPHRTDRQPAGSRRSLRDLLTQRNGALVAKPPPTKLDTVVSLCKRRGFVFPSGEIYGGTRSAWDYGPLGVELKENIKRQWWKSMVTQRDDMVGLDSSIILPAPGLGGQRPRRDLHRPADRVPVVPQAVPRRPPPGGVRRRKARTSPTRLGRHRRAVPCPNCGTRGTWTEPRQFNMMLKTYLGVIEDESGLHYLRPETAQGIFVNFANVVTSARKKPPFGIAQIGKSFRNEITPGNFIFRTREFEQMEMEFFVKPGEDEEWHQYWIDERTRWYVDLGIDPDNLRHFEHPQEKLSHYSKRTVDIEYRFGFTGSEWGELEGIANRTDFDLTTHPRHSGQDLSYFDQATGRALRALRHRAGARPRPLDDDVPRRRLHRGRGAQHQGRRRQAGRAEARPAARAGQGRGAAAAPQRRPVAQGP